MSGFSGANGPVVSTPHKRRAALPSLERMEPTDACYQHPPYPKSGPRMGLSDPPCLCAGRTDPPATTPTALCGTAVQPGDDGAGYTTALAEAPGRAERGQCTG